MATETESDPHLHSHPEPIGPTDMLANRYRLGDVLGRGSVGVVRRAVDVVLERPVAVKLFAPDSADPHAAARYEQEARLLGGLNHAGLVTVFDAGIDASVAGEPRPYLVMELVDGRTLGDRLSTGPLAAGTAAQVAGQLAGALNYIHRRGVVHRDIKPANILLADSDEPDRGEAAKLTDFGIARLVDGARITMTGFTVGTANYLSPEQLGGGPVGPPSDVYSLGLVLLECLTGAPAYPGHGAEAALKRLTAPPTIPATVSADWAALLRSMTEPDPALRPTAADVGAATSALAIGSPVPAKADEATTVLTVAPEPAPAFDAPATLLLPTAAPARPSRLRRLVPATARWLTWLAVLVTAGIIVAVVVIAQSSGSAVPRPNPPSYPSVTGRLGADLHQLQQAVAP